MLCILTIIPQINNGSKYVFRAIGDDGWGGACHEDLVESHGYKD
jgi:hypothetical protein